MAWLIQGTLPKTVETFDSVLAFCMVLLKVLQKPHVQVWGAISADKLWGKGVFAVIGAGTPLDRTDLGKNVK
ncbi:hypothetical protein OAP63_07245 [Vibrio sp.]|nr:hypothetical protein [Vibrio sp.]